MKQAVGPYLCTNPQGQEIYQIAKMIVLCWHLTFLRQVEICFPCICMGPIHLYGKNVENSYFGHLLYNPVESKIDDEH